MTQSELNQWSRELKIAQRENERDEKFLLREEQRRARENFQETRAKMEKRKQRTRRLIQIGGRIEAGMKRSSWKVFGFPLTLDAWTKEFIDDILMTEFDTIMEKILTEKKKTMTSKEFSALKSLSPKHNNIR